MSDGARPDVVVLGAGVVGLSAARELSARGAAVTVLDPDPAGGRASRAAAGVVMPSVRLAGDPELRAFGEEGFAWLQRDELWAEPGLWRPVDVVRVASTDRARQELEAAARAEPGRLGRWLTPGELADLEPALARAPLRGGYLGGRGAVVDAGAYVDALRRVAVAAGAEIRLGTGARGIEESASAVTVTTTDGSGSLTCDRLVVAAGAWCPTIGGLESVPVRPLRGQLATFAHPDLRLDHLVSGDGYLAPLPGGRILAGATEEEAGFADHVTAGGLLYLSAVVARTAPALREAALVRTWAGLRPASATGRPLVGRLPGSRRVLLATGHGGQGLLTAGLSARVLADVMASRPSDHAALLDPGAPAPRSR
ncbi:MAG TPA: FAD-dependent oxidoreductase [Candidatus Dormibacteraeota bacterium]